MEHCLFPRKVIEELRRFCNNRAILDILVPYANSRVDHCDLEHCSHFTRLSFEGIGGVHLRDHKGVAQEKFIVIKNESVPQRFIKWMPRPILNLLSVFLNNIYVQLNVKIQIVKNDAVVSGAAQ